MGPSVAQPNFADVLQSSFAAALYFRRSSDPLFPVFHPPSAPQTAPFPDTKRHGTDMGALLKLTDALLFLVFLVIALAAPLLDAQTCLPATVFPEFLLEVKSWYSREYGDYLFADKPHFFVGLVWLELLFQWPLAVINMYGILASKRWFRTTCLIYGVSLLTSMVMNHLRRCRSIS